MRRARLFSMYSFESVAVRLKCAFNLPPSNEERVVCFSNNDVKANHCPFFCLFDFFLTHLGLICTFLPKTAIFLKSTLKTWSTGVIFFVYSEWNFCNIQKAAKRERENNLFRIIYFIRLLSSAKGKCCCVSFNCRRHHHHHRHHQSLVFTTHSSLSPFPGFPAPLSPSSQLFGWSRWPLSRLLGSSGWPQSCSSLTTHPSWPDSLF